MIALNIISEKLLELALPPLITALVGLAIAVLTRKLQSLGITVTQQQQDQLKTVATEAVLAMEEKARRAPMNSQTKDSGAVGIIKDKLPNADIADIRIAVDAALPVVRKLSPLSPGTFGRSIADVSRDTLTR